MFKKYLTWYLLIAMFVIGIAPKANAGIVPSEIIAMSQADRAADLGKIQKVLEMKMVRERLEKLGFAQDEIQNKLSSLSDQQMHNLALQIDKIKVGGDGGLGIVIALLVIAILVVLLIQLTGHKVVVTK
ncbi:MAG: PA2779 family protein [Candidatus Roizmanbacteria bacterium]|nr:PA2779 family protein [Candidatus Roizmanbacteria bacterium]